MTQARRQPSTGSAWGEGHLGLDAIVAYVDEELSSLAQRRALGHLSRCQECASEVVAQTQARLALRAASAPSLPSSLLNNLKDIPQQTALPEPPAGLAVGPDGQLVSVLRPRPPRGTGRRRHTDRRVRLGAGAVVSGLALGALMVVVSPGANPAPAASPSRGAMPRPAVDTRLQISGASLDTVRFPAPSAPSGAPRTPAVIPVRQVR